MTLSDTSNDLYCRKNVLLANAPQITHLDDNPIQLIQKAKTAIATGNIKQARELVNDKAEDSVRQTIEQDPSRTDVIFDLALVLSLIGKKERAESWFNKILEQKPDAAVYNELANIYQAQGRFSKAYSYQKKALEMEPNKPEYLNNLARIMIITGQTQQGIELLKKAVKQKPANAMIHSNLLFYMHHLPKLNQQDLFDEHKRWGRCHAPAHLAKENHNNNTQPDRKLRVGYISADFRVHPVSYFFEPLLDGHDCQEIEVFGYGNVAYPDQVTERLKNNFDQYRNIRGLDDETVINLIEKDKIDILVELSGHTADNRLLVMAHKPAPIQVTYLGAPDTTGLQAIDYRFTDKFADTTQSLKFYTEELVFLPHGFICYKPPDFAPSISPLPADKNGYITFGSFNAASKINPFIIEIWSKILKQIPESRLVIKIGVTVDKQISDYYFKQFRQFGIDPDRVAICGWKHIKEHLQLYGQVDIALDTYPCNGFTTTCEALWMGLPVISLTGQCHASRVGSSILNSIDLSFFASTESDEYIAKASLLASKRETLAKIRASMRQRISLSNLYDAKAFAGQVETEYRKMWHRWIETKNKNKSQEYRN